MIHWPGIVGTFNVLAEVAIILGVVVMVLLLLWLLVNDVDDPFSGLAFLLMFPLTAVVIALVAVVIIGVVTGALDLVEVL